MGRYYQTVVRHEAELLCLKEWKYKLDWPPLSQHQTVGHTSRHYQHSVIIILPESFFTASVLSEPDNTSLLCSQTTSRRRKVKSMDKDKDTDRGWILCSSFTCMQQLISLLSLSPLITHSFLRSRLTWLQHERCYHRYTVSWPLPAAPAGSGSCCSDCRWKHVEKH